jgi:hypothetical protein
MTTQRTSEGLLCWKSSLSSYGDCAVCLIQNNLKLPQFYSGSLLSRPTGNKRANVSNNMTRDGESFFLL